MNPEDKKEFLDLAKAKEGIIREVLVHGEMNLHAIHYMIQRLFGWWNRHLHHYSLTDEDFEVATDGQKLDQFLGLCGTLFRFPGANLNDQFWDDDYEGRYSVNTWLQQKYSSGFRDLGVENTFIRNQQNICDFKDKYKGRTYKPGMTLEELDKKLRFDEPYNTVIESISVRDLFKRGMGNDYNFNGRSWRDYMWMLIDIKSDGLDDFCKMYPGGTEAVRNTLQDLYDIRNNIIIMNREIRSGRSSEVEKFFKMPANEALENQKKMVKELECILEPIIFQTNTRVLPFIDELYYIYDYGDDWCIKITCEEAYTANSNYDRSFRKLYEDDHEAEEVKSRVPVDQLQYTDTSGNIADDALREKIQKVYIEGKPICVMMDGLSVMDDVGGIGGFRDFLRNINDESPERADEVKEQNHWARMQGWTGRKFTPEKFL